MKKLTLLLAALLCFAGYSQAQTLSFNGHTYVVLPPMSRTDAVQAATGLGGYICKLETDAEFYFIDANFVKRGTGWWWTSVTANPFWANDDGSGLSNVYGIHWNPAQYTTATDGACIVMAKFQFSFRSTKWITKFGNFDAGFAAPQLLPAIVEIE